MIQRARFSLLELLVVLAIMGLVLGMAMIAPRFVPATIQADRAKQIINIAFHTASSRALSTGSTMKLSFDFEGGKVNITGVGGSRGGGNTSANSGGSGPVGPVAKHFAKYGNFDLPGDVTLNENRLSHDWEERENALYYFYPNGEAVGPALPLVIKGMIEVDIDVVRLTGKPIFVEHDF
jgi:prepilin-type N-terminal cleavage/methylation domain-containing protein